MTTQCRGQTWPDHKPWDPTPCGQPTEQTICWDCTKRLHDLLVSIADDLSELDVQLTRQSRQGPGLTARAAARPLPFDVRASDVLADVRTVLVGWVKVACEHDGRWPADTMPAMLRRIRMTSWAGHPAADELLDELRWTHAQVLACIDTAAGRRYLGPCLAPLDASPDSIECQGDVVASGSRPPTCRQCGATHTLDDRVAWLASIADDLLVNAADAAYALADWGVAVKPQAIYDWHRRGRLMTHGHDRNGHPTYRLADIRALAEAANARRTREKGPRSHATGQSGTRVGTAV